MLCIRFTVTKIVRETVSVNLSELAILPDITVVLSTHNDWTDVTIIEPTYALFCENEVLLGRGMDQLSYTHCLLYL